MKVRNSFLKNGAPSGVPYFIFRRKIMPNWINGTFKVRGTLTQLKAFGETEFRTQAQLDFERTNLFASLMKKDVKAEQPETDVTVEISDYEVNIQSNSGLVLNNLRRATTGDGTGYINEDEEDAKHIVVFENFEAAWGLDPNDVLEMAIRHNIDVYFHGFEKGMEFEQIIEVVDGKIKQSKERRYENYQWECPFPGLGG